MGLDTGRQSLTQAHIAILLANICWGMMTPVTKAVLLSGQISSIALSAIRIGGGAILFFLASLMMPRRVAPRQLPERRYIIPIIIASVLMISANQGLFILGIGYTNPIDSAVMSSLTPMLTMILAAILLSYRITWLKGLGVAIGLVGVIALVTAESSGRIASNPLLGDMMCLAAQLCAAVYYVCQKNLAESMHPFVLMKWMFVVSALTYVPCCLPWLMEVPWSELPAEIWWQLAYIIIFPTFLSYLAIPFSQQYLRPTVVSIYNYLQPLVAAVLAVMMGVGTFTVTKFIAAALILIGVCLVNTSTPSAKLSPADTER